MLVHIVMWKLKDEAQGKSKAENAERIKVLLESLPARVPEIQGFSVGIQAFQNTEAWDIVLHSVFDDADALLAYQNHPDHLDVAREIAGLRSEKAVVDYLV